MKLYIKRTFSAAHYLPNYDGACKQMHGHTWLVEVWLEGSVVPETGMLVDFKAVKNIIDELDHRCLNDIFENPTAEVIANWFLLFVPCCTKVRLWESEDCYAEVGDVQD